MPTYSPLDPRYLTTINAITNDGQKFVRIILDVIDNQFYTLDDDGNFLPIVAGSGVTSIIAGTGLSANSSTGAVTIEFTGSTAGSGTTVGTGTTNTVAKWTGTTGLGNSQIFDNGSVVGIGLPQGTTPDSRLHIFNASAGTVSPVTGTILTLENNTTNYISILAPNNNYSGIVFGAPADNFGSFIRWQEVPGNLEISTANRDDFIRFGVENAVYKATLNKFGFGVDINPSFPLDISGNSRIQGNLTASTVSATTYFNLPVSGLTQGTGIQITGQNGNFTVNYTGGSGSVYTVTNGLTENPSNNFKLGGSLTEDTFFTSGAYKMAFDVRDITGTSVDGIINLKQTANSTASISELKMDIQQDIVQLTFDNATNLATPIGFYLVGEKLKIQTPSAYTAPLDSVLILKNQDGEVEYEPYGLQKAISSDNNLTQDNTIVSSGFDLTLQGFDVIDYNGINQYQITINDNIDSLGTFNMAPYTFTLTQSANVTGGASQLDLQNTKAVLSSNDASANILKLEIDGGNQKVKLVTPNVLSLTAGDVLTLIDGATGECDFLPLDSNNVYGSFNGDVYTTGGTQGDWYKYAGTWTENSSPPCFNIAIGGGAGGIRLTNITAEVVLQFVVSMELDNPSNETVRAGWSKNDQSGTTILFGSEQEAHIKNTDPKGNIVQTFITSGVNNDVFYLFLQNVSATSNWEAHNINVTIHKIGQI